MANSIINMEWARLKDQLQQFTGYPCSDDLVSLKRDMDGYSRNEKEIKRWIKGNGEWLESNIGINRGLWLIDASTIYGETSKHPAWFWQGFAGMRGERPESCPTDDVIPGMSYYWCIRLWTRKVHLANKVRILDEFLTRHPEGVGSLMRGEMPAHFTDEIGGRHSLRTAHQCWRKLVKQGKHLSEWDQAFTASRHSCRRADRGSQC